MAANVLTGAQEARFGDLEIYAALESWDESRRTGLAQHKILKRAGARLEDTGREPFQCRMRLFFMGPTWLDQYRQLVARIDQSPFGLLVHPAIGQIQVGASIESAQVNVEQTPDTYSITISFTENQLDSAVTYNQATVASKQAEISSAGIDLLQVLSLIQDGATAVFSGNPLSVLSFASNFNIHLATASVLAINTVVSLANTFSGIFFTSFSTPTAQAVAASETQIAKGLEDVAVGVGACRTTLLADPGAQVVGMPTNIVLEPLLSRITKMYALCLDLDAAFRAFRPSMKTYIVPSDTTVAALAAQHYGSEALLRVDEILANNPGTIRNPMQIRAGTVVLLLGPFDEA